jgi:hypothetical protein
LIFVVLPPPPPSTTRRSPHILFGIWPFSARFFPAPSSWCSLVLSLW